mmetsp:Transcript_62636/g.99503  ORF Transcript_62636/g.99503 Transcript_62636/m.99503 type:complete len:244 (+) Transcript_62636:56-787(+)
MVDVLQRLQSIRTYAIKNCHAIRPQYYQQYVFKRFSSKLSNFNRPSKNIQTTKRKNESYRKFATNKPILLGESTAKRMLYSIQFVTVGLFAYSIYALAMFWNINDMLLPGIILLNVGLLLLVRSIVFAQVASVTLLPSYRLRFERFSWFARVNPKNGVEYDFHEISSISHGRYGYWFNTPYSKRMLSFPLHLWCHRGETVVEPEIMSGLLKLFEKKQHQFRWTRLNEQRQTNAGKTYKSMRWQ